MAAKTPRSTTASSELNEEPDDYLFRLSEMIESLPAHSEIRQEFLVELMSVGRTSAGIFWLADRPPGQNGTPRNEPVRLRVELAAGVQELGLQSNQQLAQSCARLAAQSLASASPEVSSVSTVPTLPPELSLLTLPLFVGRLPLGAVQIFLATNGVQPTAEELSQRLRKLVISSQVARDHKKPVEQAASETRPTMPVAESARETTQSLGTSAHNRQPEVSPEQTSPVDAVTLNQFLLELHRTLRLDHVALTAVNDGRQLLDSDRVSLAVRRGGRLRIAAISGVERVNHRADEVRSLLALAKEVARSGQTFTYTGHAGETPPQLEDPLSKYVHQSSVRMIRIVPLTPSHVSLNSNLADSERRRKKSRRPQVLGCLILESFSQSHLQPQSALAMDELAPHIALAVRNALSLRKVPVIGLWRSMGGVWESLHGRTLTKLLLALAAVIAVLSALAFIPFEYRLTAKGELLPRERQRVFAPWDGNIVKVLIDSGQKVTAGTPLVQLENEELRQQFVANKNELDAKRQSLLALQSNIDAAHREGDTQQESRLRGELLETQVAVSGLTEQVSILQHRYDQLLVTAPVDGVVATFQVDQLLRHRPVARGDQLLEIMRDDGPWELKIQIPDYRMGHLLKSLNKAADHSAPVEFVLQTNTEQTYEGKLEKDGLATRSGMTPEGQAVVEARVHLDENTPPQRRIGAEVTAKVDCGKMNLGYVLFGDVKEFLQRHLWL